MWGRGLSPAPPQFAPDHVARQRSHLPAHVRPMLRHPDTVRDRRPPRGRQPRTRPRSEHSSRRMRIRSSFPPRRRSSRPLASAQFPPRRPEALGPSPRERHPVDAREPACCLHRLGAAERPFGDLRAAWIPPRPPSCSPIALPRSAHRPAPVESTSMTTVRQASFSTSEPPPHSPRPHPGVFPRQP